MRDLKWRWRRWLLWTVLLTMPVGSRAIEQPEANEDPGSPVSIQHGTQFNLGELGIGARAILRGEYIDPQGRRKYAPYAGLSIAVEGKPDLFQQPDLGEGESVEVDGYRIKVEKVLLGEKDQGSVLIRLWKLGKTGKAAPERSAEKFETSETAKLGVCQIKTVKTYAWRDWMPMVQKPGPDGGSPLRATLQFEISNESRKDARLSYRVSLVDPGLKLIPLVVEVQPNYRLLPREIDANLSKLDPKARDEALQKYNVVWDGTLRPREKRLVELSVSAGPYAPAGSLVRFKVEWQIPGGVSATTATTVSEQTLIHRTD